MRGRMSKTVGVKITAVLEVPPVDSAETAVKAAIDSYIGAMGVEIGIRNVFNSQTNFNGFKIKFCLNKLKQP